MRRLGITYYTMFKLLFYQSHTAHLLFLFIVGKYVFKHIKGQFIRAIKGEIQSQAGAVSVRKVT